jgi:hypothetical protein
MKRSLKFATLALILTMSFSGCGSLFGGGRKATTAKQSAAQAVVTTTNAALLIMTAAGAAYDNGAFGVPGSPQAEQMWNRIAAESLRMNAALTAWQKAILEDRDATMYSFGVEQAIAVLNALLPPRKTSDLMPAYLGDPAKAMARLRNPSSFRAWSPLYAELGGAR